MITSKYNLPKDMRKSPFRENHQSRNVPGTDVSFSTGYIQRNGHFDFNSNSSDDYPSSHTSIYEAFHFSSTSSEDNCRMVELANISPSRSVMTVGKRRGDKNIGETGNFVTNHINDPEFYYGFRTKLNTITEQKSYNSLGTLPRKSMDDLSIVRQREKTFGPDMLHRQRSFSLDDLDLINSSYHKPSRLIIEPENSLLLQMREIYAQPKAPPQAPIKRLETPPGMPSWTAAQNLPNNRTRTKAHNRQISQNCLKRFLNIPTAAFSAYMTPKSLHVRDQNVQISTRGPPAPRFRPPRSAYASLDQHPFFNIKPTKLNSGLPTTNSEFSSLGPYSSFGNSGLVVLSSAEQARFMYSVKEENSDTTSHQVNFETTNTTAPLTSSHSTCHPLVSISKRTKKSSQMKNTYLLRLEGREVTSKALKARGSIRNTRVENHRTFINYDADDQSSFLQSSPPLNSGYITPFSSTVAPIMTGAVPTNLERGVTPSSSELCNVNGGYHQNFRVRFLSERIKQGCFWITHCSFLTCCSLQADEDR
ncbi:hypothetical protein K3495_g3896 [Podosphaera aphanis]|nr:hypothetical protein K3495_g3896 [Podosphaera aphanis]